MDCKKCSQKIVQGEDPYIVCNGVCSKPYHTTCIDLTKDQLLAVCVKKNVIWLCDDCVAAFTKWKEAPASDVGKPNQNCLEDIADIKE